MTLRGSPPAMNLPPCVIVREQHAAEIGSYGAGCDSKQCRFTCAIRSDDAQGYAIAQRQVDFVGHHDGAESCRDLLECEDRSHCREAPLRNWLQLSSYRNIRCRLVLGDHKIELSVLALPLASNQWRLGDVLDRRAGPLDRSDDRLVVGSHDCIEDGFGVARILCALKHIDGDFKERMLKPDGLRPWAVRRLGVCIGELLA